MRTGKMTESADRYEVPPRASRLTRSMRDIGYEFHTALADLVDNAVSAGATEIRIDIEFDGRNSYVLVLDNGHGMNGASVMEALRFGSDSRYEKGDLGRFGLGLKTGSLSQCRRITVLSRPSAGHRVSGRTLDLDTIEQTDSWLLTPPPATAITQAVRESLRARSGTAVIWEDLDRVLPGTFSQNGWGRRRLRQLAERSAQFLGMTFHRFLQGLEGSGLKIELNGETVQPWDPFAQDEGATVQLSSVDLEIQADHGAGQVRLERFVLPPRSAFSSQEAFDRMAGPMKWNRQQGIYVYRAGRLVQAGGWCGIRAIDEHTKLARAALHFNTDMDEAFRINIAKMRVQLPPTVRQLLERPVNELCFRANDVYRRHSEGERPSKGGKKDVDLSEVGLALRAAALEAGQLSALADLARVMENRSPHLARALGLL
jgi:hypothetical protein